LKLIFVLDGKPPALKQQERERRKGIKVIAEQNYQSAKEKDDIESMKKYVTSLLGRNYTIFMQLNVKPLRIFLAHFVFPIAPKHIKWLIVDFLERCFKCFSFTQLFKELLYTIHTILLD